MECTVHPAFIQVAPARRLSYGGTASSLVARLVRRAADDRATLQHPRQARSQRARAPPSARGRPPTASRRRRATMEGLER
eukprot:scaffold1106_cov608-Prasinococcus_capsulatus_cf.AAC.10